MNNKFIRSTKFQILVLTVIFIVFPLNSSTKYLVSVIKPQSMVDHFKLSTKTRLYFPADYAKKYPIIVNELNSLLNKYSTSDFKNTITFKVKDSLIGKPKSYFSAKINKNNIEIEAPDIEGIHNAIIRLKNLIKINSGKIPVQYINDYSKIDNRVLHLVIRSNSIGKYKSFLDNARNTHFNTVILMITNRVLLESFNEKNKLKKQKTIILKQDLQKLIKYANESGFKIIPEIKLLTHQTVAFSNENADFLINENTYNPNNPEVYKRVYLLIDEIIKITNPDVIHIGHDEVFDTASIAPIDIKALDPRLFQQDIITIHKYLKQRNIKTMIWGDMLWSRKIFTTMKGSKKIKPGYEQIYQFLPKDILIGDWHYKDQTVSFPTTQWFNDQGFSVWGATWDDFNTLNKFTSYYCNIKQLNSSGMIATTWHLNNSEIMKIINMSGNIFWNAN